MTQEKSKDDIIGEQIEMSPIKMDVEMSPAKKEVEMEKPKMKNKDDFMVVQLNKIPMIGVILGALSGISAATGTALVKMTQMDSVFLAGMRCFIQLVFFALIIAIEKQNLLGVKGERLFLLARAILGIAGLIGSYSAVKKINLGDANSITYSNTVFVAIFARLLLKEPLTFLQLFSTIACCGGVFLISRPSFLFKSDEPSHNNDHLYGTLYALGVCICLSFISILLRKIKSTPPAVTVSWLSIVGVVACGAMLINKQFEMPFDSTKWIMVVGVGVCGILEQYFMTLAFKLEDAGPVSVARTLNIVASFIFQVTLLDEDPVWTSLVGASIVILSVTMVGLQKWYFQKPQVFQACFPCLGKKADSKEIVLADVTLVSFKPTSSP